MEPEKINNKVPKTYKTVQSCGTCKFCIVKSFIDDGTFYYCGFENPPHPEIIKYPKKGEKFDFDSKEYEEFSQRLDEIYEWEIDRHVNESGICDEWKIKE